MKRLSKLLMGLGVFLFLQAMVVGPAHSYETVVTGYNNPAHDVETVQKAVDQGGTVLLKGKFDFGQKGQVIIKKDIEIVGESDSKGHPLTKIAGGFWDFYSPLPSTELPLPGPGPKIKIKNIHFDGAIWAPMHFPYTSGAEISGNTITNVHPFPVSFKWQGGEKLLVMAGAILGSRFAYNKKILPGAATGHLVFENNKVDLKCKNPKMTMGQGAFFIWTWGATIEIKGNRIRNVSRNSIESLDNYLDEEGRGSVVIARNNIVTPAAGIPFPSPRTPNGIIVGWFLDMSGGSDPSRNSKITVIRNYVQTNGETSVGIAGLADGIAILGNRVEVRNGSKAAAIAQLGSNAFIARNKIHGTGALALSATGWKALKSNRNTFAWNDVSEFKASVAHFLSDGNKNTLIGARCKVVDKGNENRVFAMEQ